MTIPARTAWAWGLTTLTLSGQILDAWYPRPRLGAVDSSPRPELLTAAEERRRACQVADARAVAED